jgi:hypothetical protein
VSMALYGDAATPQVFRVHKKPHSLLLIERLCEQRRVVTDVMLDTTMTKTNDVHMLLKDHEWDTMSEVSCVLKQLSNVTIYICLEKDV